MNNKMEYLLEWSASFWEFLMIFIYSQLFLFLINYFFLDSTHT